VWVGEDKVSGRESEEEGRSAERGGLEVSTSKTERRRKLFKGSGGEKDGLSPG